MRILLPFLLFFLICCAQPFKLSNRVSCSEEDCPNNYYCALEFDKKVCYPKRPDYQICSLDCPSSTQCRFNSCIEPDPSGEICEFDDACLPPKYCIGAKDIAMRCTALSCLPGETFSCYSGPLGTDGIGTCTAGFHLCDNNGQLSRECIGEITPREEKGLIACNGADDDCDGITDQGDLDHLDLVFAFDISGSMSDSIQAVVEAIRITSAGYDHPNIRLSLILFPSPYNEWGGRDPSLTMIPLLPYLDFASRLPYALLGADSSGANEASWDLPVDIAKGAQPNISFKETAKKIIIMFTDERGQSFTSPANDESTMCNALAEEDVSLYVVTNTTETYIDYSTSNRRQVLLTESFDDCATIFPLTEDPIEMVNNISNIAESICIEGND